jgi:hypothetical protein
MSKSQMKLKPIIASYSGESYLKIKQYLDDPVLDVIACVARSPHPSAEIAPEVVAELVEMHVFVEQDGLVKLGTTVFLKNDIENILGTVTPLAQEFAQRILECGVAFRHTPAEVTIFLAGILGVVQGMGRHMSQKGIGSAEWKEYAGKYARSKVDFDELCDIYDTIGPDYLNKSVLPGENYTAVFIGPGGINFQSLNSAVDSPEASKIYASHLNRYLVDAYAGLVSGKIQNEALYAAAEAAHLYQQGKLRSAVITHATMQEYGDAVRAVMEAAASYWDGKLVILDELLRSTTSGKQGVPPGNMMMHLWRYVRKVTAKTLYDQGFFTDSIPQDGCLTVFYENDVELIRQLLL